MTTSSRAEPAAAANSRRVSSRPGLRALSGPAPVTAVALLGCAYLAAVDPYDPSAPMPTCPTKLLTGLDCPACGGLRMTRALLYGNVAAAAQANLLLLVLLPLALAWGLRWWWRAWGGQPTPPAIPTALLWVLAVVAVAWTVGRNLT